MTILDQLRKKSRSLRVIYFMLVALMATVLFIAPDPPYIYAFGIGAAAIITTLVVAYRSIRCPRCGASAWLAGMGFVVPRATTGPGCNCPRCGVSFGEPSGP